MRASGCGCVLSCDWLNWSALACARPAQQGSAALLPSLAFRSRQVQPVPMCTLPMESDKSAPASRRTRAAVLVSVCRSVRPPARPPTALVSHHNIHVLFPVDSTLTLRQCQCRCMSRGCGQPSTAFSRHFLSGAASQRALLRWAEPSATRRLTADERTVTVLEGGWAQAFFRVSVL